MTKDIDEVLAAESQAVEEAEERGEQYRDLSEVRVTRGHSRSRTLQVRLNDEEMERLGEIAEARGLPTSTVARAMLLRSLYHEHSDLETAVKHALREVLRQDLLAPAS